MTGPTRKVRQQCWEREQGECARCSRSLAYEYHELHHRRARGAGGSRQPVTNLPGNLIWLDSACHAHIESHRTEALADGFLVAQFETPALVPLLYQSEWSLLSDCGGVTPYNPKDDAT